MDPAQGGRTPVVPAAVRAPHRSRPDPQLDADVVRWHDAEKRPSTPMVAVLGEPVVRAPGTAPPQRTAWHAEVLVHLAVHPEGVTRAQVRSDLWPDAVDVPLDAVDDAMHEIRTWAGTDRRSKPAVDFVSPIRSDGRFRLRGHLLDWDLLERLRTRGRARAAAAQAGAMADYRAALKLVRGPVLHPRPAHAYGWLSRHGRRLELQLVRSVVATAHELVDLALAEDDTATAQRSAELARRIDSGHAFDRPLTDLMRVAHARSDHHEVERLASVLLDLRGVDVAEELTPGTFHVVNDLLPDGAARSAPSTRRRESTAPGR